MARFYDISVGERTWSSQQNGKDDPSALDIEFDFLEYEYGTPMGASTLTIHGISLQDLQAAPNFFGKPRPETLPERIREASLAEF